VTVPSHESGHAEKLLERLASQRRLGRDDEVVLSALIQELRAREPRSSYEEELLRRAQETFVRTNLGLVRSIAGRFHSQTVSREDLVQEGTLGLMRAVELYDGRKGWRFSTYATWWIRQSIAALISESSSEISLPRTLRHDLHRLKQLQQDLGQQLGREPRTEELAAGLGMDPSAVEELLALATRPRSLESSPTQDSDTVLAEVVPDQSAPPIEGTVIGRDVARVVSAALAHLPGNEAKVLAYRFGLGGEEAHSLEEASLHFGISKERIRQIEARAIARLRREQAQGTLREILEED